jgi:hypothetical protein
VPPTPPACVVPPAGRPRALGDRSRVLAAMMVAAVVLLLPSVLGGAGGSLVEAAAGSSCASAAGTVHVGLVIDFGTVDPAGAAKPMVRQCVTIADRGTGADALSAGGHTPRWNSSGLLCAIDGYPATGCGERTATGYRYWSYWHGGDAWKYSSVGPDSFRPGEGGVEGWHFVDGTGTGDGGQVPRVGSSSPCPGSPGSTVTSTTSAARPATSGGGSGTGSESGRGTGTDNGGAATPTSAGSGPDGAAASTDPSGDAAAGADQSSTEPGTPDPSAGAGAPSGADGTDTDALGPSSPASSHGPGSRLPIGVVLVGAAVVALGVSAFVRFRTRPAP